VTKYIIMVTIYALINPFNGLPFYVGQTGSLNYRLSMHLSDFMRRTSGNIKSYTKDRDNLIKSIRDHNIQLEAVALLVCPETAAKKCEQYICNLLRDNGYTLLQRKVV